jgi:hypothetical protein
LERAHRSSAHEGNGAKSACLARPSAGANSGLATKLDVLNLPRMINIDLGFEPHPFEKSMIAQTR